MMKKIIFIMCAAVFALCMNACKTRDRSSANTGNVSVSANFSGIYTGILPCASCPGIETRIELKKDMTYTMQTKYMDKSDEIFTESGKFRWSAADSIITLDNDFVRQCLVEGNKLTVLFDGKKETGELAVYYVLGKVDVVLVEKYWKLVELYGNQVVEYTNGGKDPHIIFHIDGSRFSGDAGCNRISGYYRTDKPGRIVFSQTIVTKMMCMDMNTENKLLQALSTANSYTVNNDALVLSGEGTLARFVAIDK